MLGSPANNFSPPPRLLPPVYNMCLVAMAVTSFPFSRS